MRFAQGIASMLMAAAVALAASWAVAAPASASASTPSARCTEQNLADHRLTDLPLQVDEQLAAAWWCTDADGEQWVTVSWVRSPAQRAAQLLFTQRLHQGGAWKKGWQARDFVMGPLEASPPTPRVVLRDADGDGRVEAYLAYVLPGPTQAVDEGKLLVFFNGRKFVIKGAIPRGADDFGSRQIGSTFQELPGTVQQQALNLWDQLSLGGARAATPQRKPGG